MKIGDILIRNGVEIKSDAVEYLHCGIYPRIEAIAFHRKYGWTENEETGRMIYQLVIGVKKRELKQPIDFKELARKMPKEDVEKLKHLYNDAKDIIEQIDYFCSIKHGDDGADLSDDKCNETIKVLNKALENVEFQMQDVWGVPRDSNYHTWWLRCGYCTCPKMDNTDPAYFGGGRIISGGCPVHDLSLDR